MKAVIITIGDEILIGQTIDTNAAWLGKELNSRGVYIEQIISIRDDENSIHDAVSYGFKIADIVLMTGGLGPTQDDITKSSLCTYFDTELILSEDVLANVNKFVNKRGCGMNASNYSQAMVPQSCHVIQNNIGTAPIMEFRYEGKYLYSLPGVPFEMKAAMSDSVFSLIEDAFKLSPIFHKTIMTFGMAEAFLAEKLELWVSSLPDYVKIAYLPSPKEIKIRMSIYDTTIPGWENEIDTAIIKLKNEIPELIFSENDAPLELALKDLLLSNNLTLATAESCTGGLISSKITSLSGSSEVMKGGVVAYSNEIKEHVLNVSHDVLEANGAVSKEVVTEMSENVKNLFNTDCSIAVSGIAGPNGGTEDKPVGTTWIAVRFGNELVTKKYNFGSTREVNTLRATYSGMNMLFQLVKTGVVNIKP
jgi:nicotinamide-nucleotide amidase